MDTQLLYGLQWKMPLKWMKFGGSPISGNLHWHDFAFTPLVSWLRAHLDLDLGVLVVA